MLLTDTIWHPWLSISTRRLRTRRLKTILEKGMPERKRMLAENEERLHARERDILKGPGGGVPEA